MTNKTIVLMTNIYCQTIVSNEYLMYSINDDYLMSKL